MTKDDKAQAVGFMLSCCCKCGNTGHEHTKYSDIALIVDRDTGRLYCYMCLGKRLHWVNDRSGDWHCNESYNGYPNATWDGRYEYIKVKHCDDARND